MRFADPSSVRDEKPSGPVNASFDEPTSPAPNTEGADSDGVDLAFLDPPMDPGEIGRIAHYRVQSILGVGGMGVVLRGEDTHLRRPVALKVMRKEYVESYASRERFLQEARVAAAVESENIVTIYQVGLHNDVPFLAMQFLHGEALDERLNRQAPLPVPFALLIARQTAAGLADAHAQGLVHRDIKPANIWLETDPASQKFRRVRLLDFGLARIIASNQKLTSMGVIVGTPQYMSPEQAFGSDVDGRADLFSLGAVMYAMFTGKLPFEGKNSAAVLMALVSHNPPRVKTLNKLVPPEVDELIERLLAKEPDQRPATADEVVEILDSVLIEFSAPILGRTSGVLGYPTRGDTFPGARTTPPPVGGMGKEVRGKTLIGPQPTLSLRVAGLRQQGTSKPGATPAPTAVHVPIDEAQAVVAEPARSSSDVRQPAARNPRRHHSFSWPNVLGWCVIVTLTGLMTFGIIGPKSAPTPIPSAPANPTAPAAAPADLRVGVLYAKSGSMTALEQSLADATMLAVDELNHQGGVRGKKIVTIDVDAGQTPDDYAKQAEFLIKEKGVTTLFGSPTASDRRTVRPLIERFNALLFCPGQHEGMEQSSRIVYVGPTASQSSLPAVKYLLEKGNRRFFIAGRDNVFSRATAAVIQDMLKDVPGASLVGESYAPSGGKDFSAALKEIRAKQPDVVVNTLRGSGSVLFVQQLRSATPKIDCRVLHMQHLEDFHRVIDPAAIVGDLVACSYLESEPAAKAEGFADRFHARYGENRTVTDAMAAAYSAVLLWAKAVELADSDSPDSVLAVLPKVEMKGPFGNLTSVESGRHFRFPLLIAECTENGSLSVVHRTPALDPQVYPPSRPPADWDRYLRQLYFRWGEHWRGP